MSDSGVPWPLPKPPQPAGRRVRPRGPRRGRRLAVGAVAVVAVAAVGTGWFVSGGVLPFSGHALADCATQAPPGSAVADPSPTGSPVPASLRPTPRPTDAAPTRAARISRELVADGPIPQDPGHTPRHRRVALSRDGHRLAAGGARNATYVWDVDGGRPVCVLRGEPDAMDWEGGHDVSVVAVALSPDGMQAATSDGGELRVWDAGAGTLRWSARRRVTAVAYGPDGGLLATGARGGEVELLDAATGRRRQALQTTARADVDGVAVSADGRLVAATSGTTVQVWDTASGDPRRSFTVPVPSAPVGRAGGRTPTARARPGLDPEVDALARRASARQHGVAFSPDGARIATTGEDGATRLWNLATGAQEGLLYPVTGAVAAGGYGYATAGGTLAFTPDGRELVTVQGDLVVWDLAAGTAVETVRGVVDAAVAPDGRSVAVVDGHSAVIRFAALSPAGAVTGRTAPHRPGGTGAGAASSPALPPSGPPPVPCPSPGEPSLPPAQARTCVDAVRTEPASGPPSPS